MNSRIENQKPYYQFCLNDIDHDSDLEKYANLGLVKLLALAPPKARASGVLQRYGDFFVSVVEVQSSYRSFEEKACALTAHKSIQKVLDKLEDRLQRWRAGGNDNGNATHVYQSPQLQG